MHRVNTIASKVPLQRLTSRWSLSINGSRRDGRTMRRSLRCLLGMHRCRINHNE
jgi:hypothetical protein